MVTLAQNANHHKDSFIPVADIRLGEDNHFRGVVAVQVHGRGVFEATIVDVYKRCGNKWNSCGEMVMRISWRMMYNDTLIGEGVYCSLEGDTVVISEIRRSAWQELGPAHAFPPPCPSRFGEFLD